MIKRHIKKTIEEYDADGRLVKKTIREETEEDDNHYGGGYSFSTTTDLHNKNVKSSIQEGNNIFMTILLLVLIIVIIWLAAGFIGFLIEAKIEGWTEFGSKVNAEFVACLKLGFIALAILVYEYAVKDVVANFMNELLYELNGKPEETSKDSIK